MDYEAHLDDSHYFVIDRDYLEQRFMLGAVADVSYDNTAGDWVSRVEGTETKALNLSDQNAKDEEIIANLYCESLVYKAVIHR